MSVVLFPNFPNFPNFSKFSKFPNFPKFSIDCASLFLKNLHN